jgi:predicted secreted protein
MTTDWILRVGDGYNLIRSSRHKIWGIQTTTSPHGKYFIANVQPGDRLWFVKSKSNGKILAVATYRSHNKREFGPLINLSMTNDELGWTNEDTNWTSDCEVHYSDLYNLSNCELLTHIKGPTTIRKYDEKCRVNLPLEYGYIVRYSKISFEM